MTKGKKKENNISFTKLNIHHSYGDALYDIYYVVENGKSQAMSEFSKLNNNIKESIKALISSMATIKDFKSPQIKHNLHGYNFGEIRPMPHRFFFFQKCGDNYIFFRYLLKKEDSLDDKTYGEIDRKKKAYEEEFERQFYSCR